MEIKRCSLCGRLISIKIPEYKPSKFVMSLRIKDDPFQHKIFNKKD